MDGLLKQMALAISITNGFGSLGLETSEGVIGPREGIVGIAGLEVADRLAIAIDAACPLGVLANAAPEFGTGARWPVGEEDAIAAGCGLDLNTTGGAGLDFGFCHREKPRSNFSVSPHSE
jgi:hypothetical protein